MNNFLFQFTSVEFIRLFPSKVAELIKTHERRIKGHCLKWEFTVDTGTEARVEWESSLIPHHDAISHVRCCCCWLGQETWAQHLGLSLRHVERPCQHTLRTAAATLHWSSMQKCLPSFTGDVCRVNAIKVGDATTWPHQFSPRGRSGSFTVSDLRVKFQSGAGTDEPCCE